MLGWALVYAARNLRVFPVNARKKPIGSLTPHGCKDATCDITIIKEWWGKVPGAEPAIAIDADMVVADADMSRGQRGIPDLERLAGMSIDALDAPWTTTPSGGAHIFFLTKGRRYYNRRLPGTAVDIKSLGGYVVAPGHSNGRVWRRSIWDTPLPPAPTCLDQALRHEPFLLAPHSALAAPPPDDPWVRRQALIALGKACARIAAALPGDRNNTRCRQCFYIGGLVGRGDLGFEEAYDALFAASRAVKHDPPWREDALGKWVAQSIAAGMDRPLPLSDAEPWLRRFHARRRAAS
jgi:hypothetical protein